MKKSSRYYIRKSHRYLGLFIGIQFLFWTLGGLYFSWSSLDQIHGDHLTRSSKALPLTSPMASPQLAIEQLKKTQRFDSLYSLQLIQILDTPVYQIQYYTLVNQESVVKTALASSATGTIRPPLSRQEAVTVARNHFSVPSRVDTVEYLTTAMTNTHHEYRSKPLPAWAVHFEHPSEATVYVAAELGTFQSIRHLSWRVFDFLWMMHTMDYASRDNFNNGLLRGFAILGLLTILSGFILYFISSPSIRKLRKKRRVKKTIPL
uniref:PepSY domain-containing protein n=1 Tax=Roseihalotalea indica TaxID=2867963 RepID=A0AA49JEW7_9BACT|nr:hypothetical protein [Tunicatimonas sp. TK19036]WKN38603.1 hypothetical protein K4G66_07795 [Tunicatimonas sp. TK19036]